MAAAGCSAATRCCGWLQAECAQLGLQLLDEGVPVFQHALGTATHALDLLLHGDSWERWEDEGGEAGVRVVETRRAWVWVVKVR